MGIFMGMMPSSTRLRDTEAPAGRGSLRGIWTARGTLAPFWTRMGKGSTLMLSMDAGSGLPSQNPYSISVGGAASLNLLRSKAEVEATRRARPRSFMVTFGVALRIQRRLDTVNL